MTKTFDELRSLSDQLFKCQRPMLSLYQTLADHFYPERADFTTTRNIGNEFSDNLVDSYPIIVRRDLGNSFSSMLRDGKWFSLTVDDTDYLGRQWLERASDWQFKMMHFREAGFTRATKQGDHDFATFGQCVISVELNRNANGVLYRNWHLRDVAWKEDYTGQVGDITRRWKPTLLDLKAIFKPDQLHSRITEDCRKTPHREVEVRHLVMSSESYGDFENNKYVSVFIDVENEHIIEAKGINHPYYAVPRFQTIAGSPYAYSPATVAGLPDARCLQAMTHTLLEAAERYARPPIAATQQAVRSDVDLNPNGITWIDNEYDERLGAALRPIIQDRGGFPIGLSMRDEIKGILSSAFYLNKISLPPADREMTATEVMERMKQYRREALPLFAPIESEYNGRLCEMTFDLMMSANMFGSLHDIPESLQGRNVDFRFESPLTAGEEEKRVNQFHQTAQLLAEAAQFDQGVVSNVNFDSALREAIGGAGAPTSWLNDPEQVAEARMMQQAQALQEQALSPTG